MQLEAGGAHIFNFLSIYNFLDTLHVFGYNHGIMHLFDPNGQPREPKKVALEEPSDALPVLDKFSKRLFFGLQDGGIAHVDLASRRLTYIHDLILDQYSKERVLSAIALHYEKTAESKKAVLYFATFDKIVKYDIENKKVLWYHKEESTPASASPGKVP